jgi:hypothetical protein
MQFACSFELMMYTSPVYWIQPKQVAFICEVYLRSTSQQLPCSAYNLPDNPRPLIGRRARPWLILTEGGGEVQFKTSKLCSLRIPMTLYTQINLVKKLRLIPQLRKKLWQWAGSNPHILLPSNFNSATLPLHHRCSCTQKKYLNK